MKKIALSIGVLAVLSMGIISCKKSSNASTNENVNLSVPPLQIGQAITSSTIGDPTKTTSVKGTMLTSTGTYNVMGDLIVNIGDTLYVQAGVKVCMQNKASIVVKGVLISMGTAAQPNYFTSCAGVKINTIAQGQSPATDPAYSGLWGGINCDTSCTLLCLKYTHVDFTGAVFNSDIVSTFVGATSGNKSYAVLFERLNGDCIIEDSWFYGGTDDCIRVQYGRLSIMRNVFEKNGNGSGDVVNMKSGSVGDVAYNLFVGSCTNASKASNKGVQTVECNINMYNNTYIDGGYRQAGQAGRGGSINYEQNAMGMAYNNLIVNCRVGLRIVNNPIADTANCHYGNNYAYSDSVAVCNQFYPVGYLTHAYAYVVPSQDSAIKAGYVYKPAGTSAYNGASWAMKNNPNFVNFPLPISGVQHLADIAYVGGFDFHLAGNSAALGKGYQAFNPVNATKVTRAPFAAVLTNPGKDIGCYQADGTGNQHTNSN